jgi:hypothetical protein
LRPILRANWRWIPPSLLAFIDVLVFLGPSWGLVVFSAALVLGTLVLAFETALLAAANKSLAWNQTRNEIRDAIDAAERFIEIIPDLFVGQDLASLRAQRTKASLRAIDDLAAHGNNLHDTDTVRDILQLAADTDNMKIENAAVPSDMAERLVKLQGRVVQRLVELRRDLRDGSR